MLKSDLLKKDIFKKAFNFTLKRYNSSFKSEYFSRTKQIASTFYDLFFLKLSKLEWEFSYFKHDLYQNYLCKWIVYAHTNKNYRVTSLKLDWSFRYYNIPNLYLVVLYEIYISCLIRLVEEIIQSKLLEWYLIENKYFSYAHQISKKWTRKYLDFWKKYIGHEKTLIKQHSFFMKTDIKTFYDSIPHHKFGYLISRFMRDHLIVEKYINNNIDNFLSEFNDILFKISQYSTKGIPQGLRWSDYIAVLYLWLIFFYERENLSLSLKSGIFWETALGTKIISYSDDIVFISNNKNHLYNEVNKLIVLLNSYGLNINQNKTTDIIKSNLYDYLEEIDINKIAKRNHNELLKLKQYILEKLKECNLDILSSPNFKAYFKWIFLLDFTNELNDIFDIFSKIYWSNQSLEIKRIGILLLSISESSVSYIVNFLYEKGNNIIPAFKNFIDANKIYFSDSTLLLILRYFCKGSDESRISLKNSVLDILRKRNNPIIDCFLQDNGKFSFLPYCKDAKLEGLWRLLYSTPSRNSICPATYYQENLFWIKLNNLFGIPSNNIHFSKLKDILLFQDLRWTEFLYQVAEVIDSLLYQKYRNPVYYMKTATFIADLLSLFNQLITILVSLKKNQLILCSISFKNYSDLNFITIGEDRGKKESLIENDILLADEHKLLFFYLQKKRAVLNHKEILSILDFSQAPYNMSKYEISEVLLNAVKIVLGDLIELIRQKIS